MLNVSRSTVREAIKTLCSKGILEVRRGKGTFVANENIGMVEDPFGFIFIDNKSKLLHLYEVRLIVEPEIARLCALRIDEDSKVKLRQTFLELQDDILNNRNHMKKDIEFHNLIAKGTMNTILDRILPIINQGILAGYVKTKNEKVLHHHKNIMNAIEEGDGDKAYHAMKEHIQYALEQFPNI